MLITETARRFGLSRSALLYYDRIGLLSPSLRSRAGYRMYSSKDLERLARICSFRQAGLTIGDIGRILSAGDQDGAVLNRRLRELGDEIRALQVQQRMLARMLRLQSLEELPDAIDKQAWIEMLQAAGMDDAAMTKWHAEFERRAPEAHHRFLLSLGICEDEALFIRSQSEERASRE
jgi:DNA-binding transcriptional MerR regulator